MQSTDNRTTTGSLRRLLRRMLEPVSRILIRHGFNHRELVDACKDAYVKAAASGDLRRGKPVNISRVALVTGMARRDVRNIVNRPGDHDRESDLRQNNATRVLSGWFMDREFSSADDRPLPLPAEGAQGSFEALVRRYASDIPAGTIAKELIRVNSVARDADGKYVAISRSYVPAFDYPLTPDAIERIGSVLEDMGETIDYNLHRKSEDPSRFERRATNARISTADVPAFREFVEVEGQRYLETIDAWLNEHEQTDDTAVDTHHCRLGMGTYWIEEPAPKDE